MPRKQRNQVSNNDHIEFAAEITTSLLGQVRHLQAVLAERDEALKATNSDKSRLEVEAEGFTQRLRQLDDSEQRYKDENWNLETQLQETNAAAREAAGREQKLHQALATASNEKDVSQRDLEELKQNHSRVTEDYALERKHHDSELASFRKNAHLGEGEKAALQRKIEDLTTQNQELAKGIASRLRDDEAEPEADTSAHLEDHAFDVSEREHSPPPSPIKGGQRHSMLESETLKSSLHHAHRMIQNLKGNVHREKSEKQDLKRMLQEARDELEVRRAELNEKRLRSKSQQDMRKLGRPMLGASRDSRTDVIMDNSEHDPEWEEHDGDSPRRHDGAQARERVIAPRAPHLTDTSDSYQTANETEDAFETANERDTTDNDAFQTGAESMADNSSEELTETEGGVSRAGAYEGKRIQSFVTKKPGDRRSYQSTASTSDDDDQPALHTPIQGQPQRFKLKLNRNSRRSRIGSSETPASSLPFAAKDSPASFIDSPAEGNQSLAAELENISGDDTPSKGSISSPRSATSLKRTVSDKRSSSSMRRSISSQPSTPGARPTTMVYSEEVPPVPRIPTVDSGMMTEPWTPSMEDRSDATPGATPSSTLPQSTASAITSRIFGSSPFSTPQNKGVQSQPGSGSNLGSASTSTSTPPRPVWDQPLQYSGMIPGINQSSDTTPLSTRSATSQALDASQRDARQEERPRSSTDELALSESEPAKVQSPPLSLSPIYSLESAPVQPVAASMTNEKLEANKSSQPLAEAGTGSILGSVFGWNKSKPATQAVQILEDDTSQDATQKLSVANSVVDAPPLQEVPANTVSRSMQDRDGPQAGRLINAVYKADQGSQTVLSSEHIDSMLEQRHASPDAIPQLPAAAAAASLKPLRDIGAVSPPLLNRPYQDSDPNKGKAPEYSRDSVGKSVKRPASATSVRSRIAQYPPLPPDHQEAIAAAAQRAPSTEPTTMGPPTVPASAYPRPVRSRTASRPQTPSQQGLPSPSSKGGTTPRAGRYSTARSQASRRSSVSSFASELDERFNIRTDGMPMPQGFQANTDPRMIQAITQTMIGEMMWKYTRKAGRGEMSNTRHRRFFWVHPYTRTLYWSDRDPATANRAELKSKSVAIEAVRVVTDDNPLPPGLHRKSLIIVTPGRSVKFTAQTSQRHETWFNALSYLLLRTGPDGTTSNNAGDLTDADVNEFNPQYRRTSRSRVSLASFKSNKSQNRNIQRSLSRAPTGPENSSQTQLENHAEETSGDDRPPVSLRRRISRSLSRSRGSKIARDSAISNRDSQDPLSSAGATPHASISSRISGMWKQPPSNRESMRSRTSMRADVNGQPEGTDGRTSVNPAAVDSAEDLRRVIEEREGKGDLENVRACCDGELFVQREIIIMLMNQVDTTLEV